MDKIEMKAEIEVDANTIRRLIAEEVKREYGILIQQSRINFNIDSDQRDVLALRGATIKVSLEEITKSIKAR